MNKVTTINFDKTPDETLTHFKGRVQRSISNMCKAGYTVNRTTTHVCISAPLAAVSYITPKIID